MRGGVRGGGAVWWEQRVLLLWMRLPVAICQWRLYRRMLKLIKKQINK